MRMSQISLKVSHMVTFFEYIIYYVGVSCDIMKLHTCSSFHSWTIATSRITLLSKSLVTLKLLDLEYLVEICYSSTFGSATYFTTYF